jgi:hypothetical protein
MATIHRTTMSPGKLDLLAAWLPGQPWYRDTGRPPALTRAGGFRLDDPAGDVGIEFVFVTDGTEGEGTTYHVPLAYRGAPLPGAEAGLVGTSEHGVLGTRWIYDAAHDPVAIAQFLAFIGGTTKAQHQNQSDTPDRSVIRQWTRAGRLIAPSPLEVSITEPGRSTVAVELVDGESAEAGRFSLELIRVLREAPVGEQPTGLGSVDAEWARPDGGTARGTVVVVR